MLRAQKLSGRKEIQMSKREYTSPTRKGCKRCGSKTVAWQQNERGKWYLTEVFEDADGRTYTEYREFHSAYCTASNPNLEGDEHELEQQKRLREEKKNSKETTTLRKAREDREAAEEASYFLELHDLCKNQRAQALDQLGHFERELDSIASQPTSMDYMVDHMNERARASRLRAEIAFMKAALGMATEYDDE